MSAVDLVYEGADGPWVVARAAQRGTETLVEYSDEHLDRRIEFAPVHHPTTSRSRRVTGRDAEHLPGLIADSLPDAWGRLLLRRDLRQHGVDDLGPLRMLTWLGPRTMGALTFHPADGIVPVDQRLIDLDLLQREMLRSLEGAAPHDRAADALTIAAGSGPGGARPKLTVAWTPDDDLIADDGADLPAGSEPWLLKFHGPDDGPHLSTVEATYLQMAAAAGISACDHRLLTSPAGTRYLAVRRFDRRAATDGQPERIHMASAAGLLESYPEYGQFTDYASIIRLTRRVTGDQRDVVEMVRRAVFNVIAHNRDDHARNTAFLWTPMDGWRLAPAYDLTHSMGPRPTFLADAPGEHYLDVAGKGKDITREDLRSLSSAAGIKPGVIDDAIEATLHAVARWPDLASSNALPDEAIDDIATRVPALAPVG